MKLALDEDQVMIRDAAEAFLGDVSDSAGVRRAMALPQGHDPEIWSRIGEELGWCGIAIDEAHGGLGLGALTLALVQEQAGRHLLCAPFYGTVCVAATLLAEAGTTAAREEWLPAIAAGERRVSLPLDDWRGAGLSATAEGERTRLSGEARMLVDPHGADALWLWADDGLYAVAADADGLEVQAFEGWDATRRFATARLSQVEAVRLDDPARADGRDRALALARLYLAAEQLGEAQRCLDLTVEYTAGRKQFGRPIAGFQAVKHRCAEMMVRIEALRSGVYGTAAAATTLPSPALAAEAAGLRAMAAETAFWCAQEAIQLHGGVGFTWEYDPQLYFKRAQASRHWLGEPEALLDAVADALLDGSAEAGDDNAGESESLAAFRAEVAGWMREHLRGDFEPLRNRGGPGDEEADPEGRKAWERTLAAGGWTSVGWPREHGGRGLSIEEQVVYHEEYARAGGPGRMGHIGEGLLGPALIRFGTEAQQQRFLPAIVAGTEYWAQGYSEPNAGSDLANVQTRCWQEADGSWRVSGQKIWTSLAHESDWIFVLARCEPGSRGNKGLAFLLMPLEQPGIEIRPIRQLSGGSEFNEVFFDGARAEAEHMVGAPGEGWKVAMGLLEAERGVSTLGQQMHFTHELALVLDAARRRGVDSRPAFRARLAQAWVGLRVMRYNALRTLAPQESDALGLRREALIYKYWWSNWHRDLGRLAMDVLGPEGDVPTEDPAIQRLQQVFFFARADTIYAGTNEIQFNLIAERGLGMPREPRPAA